MGSFNRVILAGNLTLHFESGSSFHLCFRQVHGISRSARPTTHEMFRLRLARAVVQSKPCFC